MYKANKGRYSTISGRLGLPGPKSKSTSKPTKKPAQYIGVKKSSTSYKVPKTPKVSGKGWGG